MPTNEPFDSEEGYSNPFKSVFQSAVALAPIGAGGVVGLRRLQSNAPVRPEGFGIQSVLREVGANLGTSLRQEATRESTRREAFSRKFAEELTQGDTLGNIRAKVQDINTVVQMALSTIDDPSSGLDVNQFKGYKEQLLNAMKGLEDSTELENVLGSLVDEIFSSNESARKVFEGQLREFKGLSPQLEAPTFVSPAGRPFHDVSIKELAFNKSDPQARSRGKQLARQRFDQLQNLLSGSGAQLDIVRVAETTGQEAFYARVSTQTQGKKRFQTMLPLNLNVAGTGTPYTVIRSGEAATAYRGSAQAILGPKAQAHLANVGKGGFTEAGLRGAGAIVDIEDYYITEFEKEFRNAGRNIFSFNRNRWNAFYRYMLSTEPRGAGGPDVMGQHLAATARFTAGHMPVVGMENVLASSIPKLLKAFGASSEFDLGLGPDQLAESRYGFHRSFFVGRRGTSAIASARLGLEEAGFGLNRFLQPITSRIEQVTKRESMFLGRSGRMGRGGAFRSGAVGLSGENILWSKHLTGGTNRAILLDVGGNVGKIFKALEDTGQAYGVGNVKTRSRFTIPIADPEAHNVLSSSLLNRVMANPGEAVSLTSEEIKRGFIGMGQSGPKFLPRDPNMTGLTLRFQQMSDSAGKHTLHLVGDMDRDMNAVKLFGRTFKGMMENIGATKMLENLGAYNIGRGTLSRWNVGLEDLVVTSGDMLSKAPATFIQQMITGTGIVSDIANPEQKIAEIVKQIRAGSKTDFGLSAMKVASGTAVNELGLTTAAVMHALKGSGATPEDIGRVLAATYNKASGEDLWLQGSHAQMALDRDALTNAIKSHFRGASSAVLASARQGLAIAADTFTQGEGIGDWSMARGSVEPRFIENLQLRLRDMGLSMGETNEFIHSIYRRKVGYADHMKVADSMVRMVESITGSQNISGLPRINEARAMTLDELSSELHKSGKNLADFMREQKGGVQLDIGSHANTRTQALLRSAARKSFGGQTQIFLPGGEALEAMRGTFIKTEAGEASVAIDSKYGRMLTNFGRDLGNLVSGDVQAKSLNALFKRFTEEAAMLATTTISQLPKGRVKGSAFMVARQYDIMGETNLTGEQARLAKLAMQKSKGTAVFVDHKGFLSMVKDFMGAGGAGKQPARMLQMFFTGMERGESGKTKGLVSVGTRHPLLSRGNVLVTQMFRDVREVGKGDELFAQIAETKWGQKALGRFGGKITSFADIARVKGKADKKARRSFFDDFASNLKSFYKHEGGGSMFTANQKLDVHFDGKKRTIDFSLSSQALGDFDGDQWGMFLVDKRASKRILSTLKDPAKMESYLRADTLYQITSSAYTKRAKDRLAASGVTWDPSDVGSLANMIKEDALKEKAAKEAVGQLDVRLGEIRRAVLNMKGADLERVSSSLALLKVLEEHTTIKGKKLPVFRPFAEQLTHAAETLLSGGGIGEMESFLRREVFSEDFMRQGTTITDMNLAGAPEWIKDVSGSRIDIQRDLDFIRQATAAAQQAGTRGMLGGTPWQLMQQMFRGGSDAFRDIYTAGQNIQAGMLSSGIPVAEQAHAMAGSVVDQFMRFGARMNRTAVGAVVAGTIGTLGLLGAMGDPGFSPQPLNAPGEVNSPRIQAAMASGEMLQPRDSGGMTPQDMAPGRDPYAMMNRPINTGSTYVNRGGSYQVGVETSSPRGVSAAASMMSMVPGMGSGSSVTINDTRRPLTRHYIDRIMGDY